MNINTMSTIGTQLWTVSAGLFVFLARMWETEGIGLNPWISIPLACLCMAIPHLVQDWLDGPVIDAEDEHEIFASTSPHVHHCHNDPVEPRF